MSTLKPNDRAESVRRFNRYYSQKIGALNHRLLDSPYSLAEVRVLYELAHATAAAETTAGSLSQELGIDAGYVSRILRRLQQQGLIRRKPSPNDGRQSHLSLTKKGDRAFQTLNALAQHEIESQLAQLPHDDQRQLVESMTTIQRLLERSESKVSYVIRPGRAGDFGWVIYRHGVLYVREYGWNQDFEALVAEIVVKFIRRCDPDRDRCWIAEKDGQNVGSVFLVRRSAMVGQLRLLLVEPSARRLGIGRRLVEQCLQFARQVGYRKVALWTNDVLHAARQLYESFGFQLADQSPHHSFGHDLVEQTWVLNL